MREMNNTPSKTLIESDALRIVFTDNHDIAFVVAAEQSAENAQYIGSWSYDEHESAIMDANVHHLIFTDSAGDNVGYAILRGITDTNDSIELMRIVITKKGKGYGNLAISLIKKWCFEVRKAHRLWLDVRENNLCAQHVYKRQGFRREGVLRECIKIGDEYQSLVVMSILSYE